MLGIRVPPRRETIVALALALPALGIVWTPGKLVFSRTVTLKDTWAKLQAQGRHDA